MKYDVALVAALAGIASARDIPIYSRKVVGKREVPQEHSHEGILRAANDALKLDNPLEIQDAVFSLLGNAAAALGAPNVENLDCLQQIVADQALTNAKAAGDLEAAANAILFRALEKNTLTVGEASPLCDEVPVNAELVGIQQHQDPASPEAAGNADIELAVAIALASIGADPLLALNTATFPPGEVRALIHHSCMGQVLTLTRLATRLLLVSLATTRLIPLVASSLRTFSRLLSPRRRSWLLSLTWMLALVLMLVLVLMPVLMPVLLTVLVCITIFPLCR